MIFKADSTRAIFGETVSLAARGDTMLFCQLDRPMTGTVYLTAGNLIRLNLGVKGATWGGDELLIANESSGGVPWWMVPYMVNDVNVTPGYWLIAKVHNPTDQTITAALGLAVGPPPRWPAG